MKRIFVPIITALLCLVGCKTSQTVNEHSGLRSVGPNGAKLLPPDPGKENQPLIGKQAVIDYMIAYRKRFYEDKQFLFVTDDLKQKAAKEDIDAGNPPGTTKPGPDMGDMLKCLDIEKVNWSPLVQHFYCLHGSYQTIVPNMRGCFSYLAGGVSVNERGWYPEIFDFCTYQDYDAVINAGKTKFDVTTLVKNKIAGNRVGVMKYLTADEEEVFKYVLWTWYNPLVYSIQDQQDVLDAFWGPGNYDVANIMRRKQHHPEYDDIVPFMTEIAKNGGEVPWPGTKDVNGNIIPVPPAPPPLQPHEVCWGWSDNGTFVEINEPATATVTFSYRPKVVAPAQPKAWKLQGALYDKARARWQGVWDKGSTMYDLKWMVDGTETITDVTQALKRKCP
jgi:hypothetical protein